MTVFVNIRDLYMDSDSHAAKALLVLKRVSEEYNYAVADPDAYLYMPDSGDEIDCIFGSDDPAKIIETADGWNLAIQKNFQCTLDSFLEEKEKKGVLPFNDTKTYLLKQAVMALDNDFYMFGDWATLLTPVDSLKVIINAEELDQIHANPENYAVIEVCPK